MESNKKINQICRIPLTMGKCSMIDLDDYEKVAKYKWQASYNKSTKSFYAVRFLLKNDKSQNIRMHGLIMNVPKNMIVDHINHNTLDNRKRNLRICTHTQNVQNKRKTIRKKTSKYKGVSWDKKETKWKSGITVNKKLIRIGLFINEIDAAIAYDIMAKKYFGEFAYLNFT